VPSAAKGAWETVARVRLGELERLHADARGTGPGRRWGTDQLNRSLFVALVAQFQIYCRDLHDEAIDVHVAAANVLQAGLLRSVLTQGRELNVKNPRPAALGSDFGRLGSSSSPRSGPRAPRSRKLSRTLIVWSTFGTPSLTATRVSSRI
jgi:hypothetical protein